MLGVAWPSVRAAFGQPLAALGEVAVAQTAGFLIDLFVRGTVSEAVGNAAADSLAEMTGLTEYGRDVGQWDVVRVAPQVTRAFEAGPGGLELIVFGAGETGDATMIESFWEDA